MAAGKEVKAKIGSIKNTQKITSAMEMVAASKMRRTQDAMRASQPYSDCIEAIIAHLAATDVELRHPYLTERPARRVAYIVVATDRGLCGGLNINLFKRVLQDARKWQSGDAGARFCALGNKAAQFFQTFGGDMLSVVRDLGDAPALTDIIGGVMAAVQSYDRGETDRIYLAANEFVNTMTQKPQLVQLLPFSPPPDAPHRRGDYIYEPDDAGRLLSALMVRCLEARVYQAVLTNKACEMAARMLAMRNATENAGNFIDELQMLYNKTRQAAITQELSEIVGGAAAI